MSDKIIVTVAGQARGTNAQEALGFIADNCEITKSWGLQPGTAVLSWVKEASDPRTILPLAAITIEQGGHTFYGVCENAVAVDSHEGRSLTQQFVDSRTFLQYDLIYAQFNIRDSRMVNGRLVHRYRHLLPANYNAHHYTFTDSPYWANQILDFCFNAATVECPWTRSYVSALFNPVLDVDAYSGKKLGTLIAEVSARCATTFTSASNLRYGLVWVVKGVGAIPVFPANATERRLGLTVTENPTRIRVLGDRNQYQVLNVTLEKDWLTAWEQFLDVDLLADDLFLHERTEAAINGIPANTFYNNITGDTDQLIGRHLAAARARTILVGEYATLRDNRASGTGAAFRDARRAFGQSRLQMPAVTYIQALLFRAFRPPANFAFTNWQGVTMPLIGMDILGQSLTEITHNPTTGVMTALPGEQRMVGNGYAIARGYNVGVDGFKTLRPGYFRLEDWVSAQNVWQALPFQIDDSGEDGKFVIFNEPVVVSSDLISSVAIESVTQDYPALKRVATITVPPVRVALTFAGERYSLVRGTGTRDDVENVSGLNGLFLVTGGILTELPYGDGETATQKAQRIADNLLGRQFVVVSGGYNVQGSNATALDAMKDRISVSLSGQSGLNERVDFANARERGVDANGRVQLEPVRDFERVQQLQPLFPGERENRETANQLRVQASALRHNPKLARLLYESFYGLMGLDAKPETHYLTAAVAETTLPAGCPLFADSTEKKPWMPDDVTATAARLTAPVFYGATVFDNEKSDGPVRATRTGGGNVVLLRVKGPVSFNDSVGLPKDPDNESLAMVMDYVTGTPHTSIGTVQKAVADGVIAYVPVRVGGGGGTSTGGMRHRGEWSALTTYAAQDVVVRGPLGEFVCFQAPPIGTAPETGAPYWHAWLSQGTGEWS